MTATVNPSANLLNIIITYYHYTDSPLVVRSARLSLELINSNGYADGRPHSFFSRSNITYSSLRALIKQVKETYLVSRISLEKLSYNVGTSIDWCHYISFKPNGVNYFDIIRIDDTGRYIIQVPHEITNLNDYVTFITQPPFNSMPTLVVSSRSGPNRSIMIPSNIDAWVTSRLAHSEYFV